MSPAESAPFSQVRLDKWLWSVRLFKTRALAADACRLLRVRLANQEVKASRTVRIGDVFEIHLEDIVKTVRVRALLEKRVAGKAVVDFMDDLTSPETYAAAKERREALVMSPPIAPNFKPSKKDRELLAKLYRPQEDA